MTLFDLLWGRFADADYHSLLCIIHASFEVSASVEKRKLDVGGFAPWNWNRHRYDFVAVAAEVFVIPRLVPSAC